MTAIVRTQLTKLAATVDLPGMCVVVVLVAHILSDTIMRGLPRPSTIAHASLFLAMKMIAPVADPVASEVMAVLAQASVEARVSRYRA